MGEGQCVFMQGLGLRAFDSCIAAVGRVRWRNRHFLTSFSFYITHIRSVNVSSSWPSLTIFRPMVVPWSTRPFVVWLDQ